MSKNAESITPPSKAEPLGLNWARPLLFENSDASWRYSMRGSCFLCRFHSRFYAITARHCLSDFSSDAARISGPIEGTQALQFFDVREIGLPGNGQEDCSDLAFFLIEPALADQAILDRCCLDLTYCSGEAALANETLIVVGYPWEQNSVEYENLRISTKGYAIHGRYHGTADSKHCSRLSFETLGGLNNLDGLSGSPVIAFIKSGEDSYSRRFVGVLIRGSATSRQGSYVDSARVVYFLRQFDAHLQKS